ncbi:MAG: TonB-dependent receptor domain-containing protein [Burkholderiaceae bacterium]
MSDALPATTVITRADIEDSHASDLATLLRGQVGIDVAQSGGTGSQTSLFMRGANSNQVLVLIDGLRVNAVGSGAASIAHLMIDQIDHVEIVRGNVSSLYGSEAIGGVIQIFTRGGTSSGDSSSERSRIGLNAEWGGDRTRAGSFDATRAFGANDARTRIGLATSYRSAKGFSAIDADRVPAANPDDDGYRNASVSAQVAQQIGPHEIGIRYFETHGHLEFDDPTDYSFFGPPYDGRMQTHNERTRLTDAALYGKFKPTAFWTLDLQAGQARDVSVNTSSYPASFVVGTATSTDRQYRIGNSFAFADHTVMLAYEHLDQSGFSTSYGSGLDGAAFSRKVDSAMAGYTGPLFLTSAVNEFQFNARHDRYSDFGDATTGLAAYGLKFAPGWKAIVQASTAFKAPSFNELYFPFFGNPALKPERARSIEAALQYAREASYVRASLFRTRTRDLIVFDPLLLLANNVDRARVTGVELSARTIVDGWTLSANVTLQRPIDEATGERLLRRASRNLGFAIAKSFGRWRVSADAQAAGMRFDSDITTFTRTELAGYGVANFGVRYEVVRATTVGLSVTNAFDKRYALVDGYNTAGRVVTVSLGVRY